ncbi:hypothetical protein ACSVIJ_05130 [Pseudomonas sp. NCHU5208]|uniref:hypothetical protein n=1 Tax=unclassified Pseudomonas TaxID=196821 RepID=UPI003F980E5A
MGNEQADVEGFELAYSVQIDSSQVFELLVDEAETGDSIWQTVNASGQVLSRSERYKDQALCMRDGLVTALPVKDYYEQVNDEVRLSAVASAWDSTDSLSPENIKSTVMRAMHQAFSRIRMFAQDDPALSGMIADLFHNLPDALENWSHDDLRQEAIRALHALTIKPHLKGK